MNKSLTQGKTSKEKKKSPSRYTGITRDDTHSAPATHHSHYASPVSVSAPPSSNSFATHFASAPVTTTLSLLRVLASTHCPTLATTRASGIETPSTSRSVGTPARTARASARCVSSLSSLSSSSGTQAMNARVGGEVAQDAGLR